MKRWWRRKEILCRSPSTEIVHRLSKNSSILWLRIWTSPKGRLRYVPTRERHVLVIQIRKSNYELDASHLQFSLIQQRLRVYVGALQLRGTILVNGLKFSGVGTGILGETNVNFTCNKTRPTLIVNMNKIYINLIKYSRKHVLNFQLYRYTVYLIAFSCKSKEGQEYLQIKQA